MAGWFDFWDNLHVGSVPKQARPIVSQWALLELEVDESLTVLLLPHVGASLIAIHML